ncbi:uncharacterized protein TM35_000043020 [Trypanosoma theileri]|uniref:Uncharacterized protein n=1 Tax=Trypanosoma theileri TaxID=67003 RepID=A0A1X0P5H1_9TRYP|nr:uncharacterized protein TM35_000043020 [Trypanosoma theileri]ORC92088.1 hypothetical protein TM35_000043020 [Trypanosoma theileri]
MSMRLSEQISEHDAGIELDRMKAAIESYAQQLEDIDNAIQTIQDENQKDEVSRQIVDYQTAYERNPASIPAEDALDTITRLQNTLKIVKRRNHLLARENTTQQKFLQDRSKFLLRETDAYNTMVDKTGWHEQYMVDHDDVQQKGEDVKVMADLEAKVRRELRAAQSIIKKKEALVVGLEAQVERGEEIDTTLNMIFNDIRVKERDARELEIQLERLRKDDKRYDDALTVFESQQQNASLACVETDRDFLKDAVLEMKAVCRRQDNVMRAQMTRQQQLHARLDTIFKSLREMRLEEEFKRNVPKSALVPSACREEPEDVSKILPEEEFIPIHTYRLIHKNNETMRTNVARKNMLVLEKEGVIQALDATLAKYADALNMTSKQQEELKHNKELEMDELTTELQEQHQNYLRQLEQLMQENVELKKKLNRSAPAISAIKNY